MLLLVLFFIGLLLLIIGLSIRAKDNWRDWEFPVTFGIIILVVVAILFCYSWHNIVYKEVTYTNYLYTYKSLTYQLENDYYNKITYDGRKELMNDILEYNQAIITGRAKHNSFWIGCLYPTDYESLPLIELCY